MLRPLALDLYSGAGGAGAGLWLAGFDVIGYDHRDQPRYPFEHRIRDLAEPIDELIADLAPALIWASPPCQRFSAVSSYHGVAANHADLIEHTRAALVDSGRPYIIENVPGAPLINPIKLAGDHFGLGVDRARIFELSHFVLEPSRPGHNGRRVGAGLTGVYGHGGGVHGPCATSDWQEAMGIGWMKKAELAQAIPPAYAQWLAEAIAGPAGIHLERRVEAVPDNQTANTKGPYRP